MMLKGRKEYQNDMVSNYGLIAYPQKIRASALPLAWAQNNQRCTCT